jgi:hypothetical protein
MPTKSALAAPESCGARWRQQSARRTGELRSAVSDNTRLEQISGSRRYMPSHTVSRPFGERARMSRIDRLMLVQMMFTTATLCRAVFSGGHRVGCSRISESRRPVRSAPSAGFPACCARPRGANAGSEWKAESIVPLAACLYLSMGESMCTNILIISMLLITIMNVSKTGGWGVRLRADHRHQVRRAIPLNPARLCNTLPHPRRHVSHPTPPRLSSGAARRPCG